MPNAATPPTPTPLADETRSPTPSADALADALADAADAAMANSDLFLRIRGSALLYQLGDRPITTTPLHPSPATLTSYRRVNTSNAIDKNLDIVGMRTNRQNVRLHQIRRRVVELLVGDAATDASAIRF